MAWSRPIENIQLMGHQQHRYRNVFYNTRLEMFTPEEGRNEIRIIQPLESQRMRSWAFPVFLHRNVGAGPNVGDYICRSGMQNIMNNVYDDRFDGRCFACEQYSPELWNTDRILARSLMKSKRYLVYVVRAGNIMHLLLWSAPYTLVEAIIQRSSLRESPIDVSNPFSCPIISFEREGSGLQTRYNNIIIHEFLTSPIPESIDRSRVEFREFLNITSYEGLRAIMDPNSQVDEEPVAERVDRRLDI